MAPLNQRTAAVIDPILSTHARGYRNSTFIASALSIAGIIFTVGFAAFPFLLPSISQPGSSLTVWDASSSHLTLWIMLICTIIFLPLIIGYTTWVYRVLKGKVTVSEMDANPNAY